MKQVLQSLNNGATEVAEVPAPVVGRGQLLIGTARTLVSAGTERMLVDFGKSNLIDKARQQPDKVRQVIEKIRTDGLGPTLRAVRSKLEQPLPMGYCNAGVVLDVGAGVLGFAIGDRVASNGKHAEIVAVPQNLCAKIPDGVDDEAAAFTVIGAIALQGIRLANPTLGETVVVTGLGLIGLIAVQLLRAQGCRVLGIDLDPAKLELARQFGAETVDLRAGEDPIAKAQAFSRGRGVDAVLITASTKSNEPVHQAALMCRKRGRIVLVGVVGLELSRADFYEKELSFQVSCSYGPGRYDVDYEERGHDYPVGYVRWTEQRNFEAFLDMVAERRITLGPLISHRFAIDEAPRAYELISGAEPSLGVILEFSGGAGAQATRAVAISGVVPRAGAAAKLGFVGAGNYAGQVLIPAFAKTGAALVAVCSATGVSGVHVARKHGIATATTDADALIVRDDLNAVVVTTRHDSHAKYVCQALRAGKHVFVEKPLALNRAHLGEITNALGEIAASGKSTPLVMVGFNRRFAPQVVKLKALLAARSAPKSFIMTVNAGAIPPEHWTQDPSTGGGRIIGEGCHFIDLLRFLAGAPIASVHGVRMGAAPGIAIRDDKASFTLSFADGSFGTVHYLANGHRSFPKERLEVFCDGGIIQLDNFRKMTGWGWPGFKSMNVRSQDKGNAACAAAFVRAIETGAPAPIPLDEILEVAERTFDVAEGLG